MSYWDVLGITSTTDILIIKKAYAKQLKSNHPEDNPSGFQMVREAYDNALKYANDAAIPYDIRTIMINDNDIIHNEFIANDKEMEQLECNQNDIVYDINHELPNNIINERFQKQRLIDDFFTRLDELYSNFPERINIKNWEALLSDDIMWQFDLIEYMNTRLINYLTEHPCLSRPVWKYLNTIYRWDEQEHEIKNKYPSSFTNYLMLQLGDEPVPRFNIYKDNFDHNKYYELREQAYMEMINNVPIRAKRLISEAFEIYNKDPDLYCIRGDFYYQSCNSDKAIIEFELAEKIAPDDFFVFHYHLKVMLEMGLYLGSYKMCKSILSRYQDNQDAHAIAGLYLYKLGKWREASKILLANLERYPKDDKSRSYLKKIQEYINNNIAADLLMKFYLKKIDALLGKGNRKKRVTFKKIIRKIARLITVIIGIFLFIIIGVLTHGTTFIVLPFIFFAYKSLKG